MRVHCVGNLCVLIGSVFRNTTLSWNHWLKRNGYGRYRSCYIIIGIMWMEWDLPSKASMNYCSGPPHHIFLKLMFNCWGSPVIEVRKLLTSLWCQNWWIISGERICWKIVTCPFMWILDWVIGQLICMSICWSVYTYPCWIVSLGTSDNQYRFCKWRGIYVRWENTK